MSPTHVPFKPDRRDNALALFFLICLVSALVRARSLFEPALWFDESFSIFYVKKSLSDIWGHDWHLEPTPPLYYSLLHLWTSAFGFAEPTLRALSLLASSLAAGVIFLAGREAAGLRAGLGAGLIWSVLPLAIDYGLEIRAYALEFLVIALLLWSFIRLIHALDGAKNIRLALIPFTIFGIVASYTHITAILAFASFALVLISTALIRRRDCLGAIISAGAVYTLALLPQILASYAVVTQNKPTLAWLVRPGLMDALAVARALLVGNMVWGDPGARIILALWCLCGIAALVLLRHRPLVIVMTLGVALLGFLLFFAASFVQPILLNRTLLWVMIPAIVFIAAGLAQWTRAPSLIAFCLLIGASGWAAQQSLVQRSIQRGDDRGIAEVSGDTDKETLIVTVDGEMACQFVYFHPQTGPRLRLVDLGRTQEFQRTQSVDLSCNHPTRITLADLQSSIDEGKAIWIVGRTPYYENGARMYRDTHAISESLRGKADVSRRIENYSFFGLRLNGLNHQTANAGVPSPSRPALRDQ